MTWQEMVTGKDARETKDNLSLSPSLQEGESSGKRKIEDDEETATKKAKKYVISDEEEEDDE